MLNVLIVGCGAIAGGYDAGKKDGLVLTHAAAYRRDGRFRVAACVDPDAEKRGAFADHWGIEGRHATLAEALEDGPFDVVSLCSPTSCHAEDLAVLADSSTRLVFCEKPIAPELADAERGIAALDAKGIAVAVNHTRRWDPVVAALKADLDNGKWGKIRSAVGYYNKGILNNGSHMIDLLHWLLGGPLAVVATGDPVSDWPGGDPTVAALLTSPLGVPVQLAGGAASDYALFELHLVTERGVVCMEDGGFAWRIREVADSPHFPGYRVVQRGEWTAGGYVSAMTKAVANIHDFLADGTPLASTGQTALAAQAVCKKIGDASARRLATKEDAA